MELIKTQFSRNLYLAFGAMLAIALALAGYFYFSVQRFGMDVKRDAILHSLLGAYSTVSVQTTQVLNLMEASVEKGNNSDLILWHNNVSVLRSALDEIRQTHVEESALVDSEAAAVEIEALDKLDNLVERFLSAGESVIIALDTQRLEDARATLQRLHSEGTIDVFNFLMDETVSTQVRKISDSNIESVSRAQHITQSLPFFMLILAGFTALLARFFSRELAVRRASLSDSNLRLEAIIEEGTRALTTSNEMLAHADENRRRLLADISHQFRTPLTVIRGEAEIALRGNTKTTAEYQEILSRIVAQADQTAQLVDGLLFIARAVAGDPRLNIRPVSIGSLLATVCKESQPQAEQNKIRIVQMFKENSAVVMGDSGRLRQVFSILIHNAIRHSAQRDTVAVDLLMRGTEIILTVSDDGISLTNEEAQQVCQDSCLQTKPEGAIRECDLGLQVVKAIVEAHKGSITLEGKPGKGVIASVTLPMEVRLKAVA